MTKPQTYFSIFSFGYSLAPTSSSNSIYCSIPPVGLSRGSTPGYLTIGNGNQPGLDLPSSRFENLNKIFSLLEPQMSHNDSYFTELLLKLKNIYKILSVTCLLAQCRPTISTQSVVSASSLN